MIPEEFLVLLRKTRHVIDDAVSQQSEIGVGVFLTYWNEYKRLIFSDYTQECLDSRGFQDYVWHMMCMTHYLDKQIPKDKIDSSPSNVVNFYDYQAKHAKRIAV